MSARESIIPVFVPHLGCPNDCVFCNQRRISGAQEPAGVENVKNAIESAAALPRNGAKRQLAFYGGSFTAIPSCQQEALLGAAKEYLDRDEIDAIRLSTRPDAIDGAVLARLKRYGVETIELGAQSLCDEILLLSGRGHTAADVVNASEQIKAAGFRLILQMMTGLPGDSVERTVYTAKKIIALHPDGVRIYPTVIVRDTALYDLWQAGEYKEHTVADAVEYCAAIVPLFEAAGIPIIRLGLNPTDELSGGAAAGGAYHPALGELVKSRLMLYKMRGALNGIPAGSRVTLGVNKSRVSQAVGQHRENVSRLTAEFGLKELKIRGIDEEKDEISIDSIEKA